MPKVLTWVQAKITVKVGKNKLVCKVTVEAPKLNKTKIKITEGNTEILKLTGTKNSVVPMEGLEIIGKYPVYEVLKKGGLK